MNQEEKDAIWAARHRTLIGFGTRVAVVASELFKPHGEIRRCDPSCIACFENVDWAKTELLAVAEALNAELALWNPTPDSVVLKRQMEAIRASRAAMAETEGGQA